MNMFKSNGGFTLVELIVVIAILAILAGLAVPAYSGYISKAQEANDMTQLDSIKTAATFEVMEEKGADCKIDKIVVTQTTAAGAFTVSVDYTDGSNTAQTNYPADVSDYVGTTFKFKSDNNVATLDYAATAGESQGKWVLSGARVS